MYVLVVAHLVGDGASVRVGVAIRVGVRVRVGVGFRVGYGPGCGSPVARAPSRTAGCNSGRTRRSRACPIHRRRPRRTPARGVGGAQSGTTAPGDRAWTASTLRSMLYGRSHTDDAVRGPMRSDGGVPDAIRRTGVGGVVLACATKWPTICSVTPSSVRRMLCSSLPSSACSRVRRRRRGWGWGRGWVGVGARVKVRVGSGSGSGFGFGSGFG